jgi:hypothetical protein
MLQELTLALPKFHVETEISLENINLENTLVDVFAELICFFAHVIRYFKVYCGHSQYYHCLQMFGLLLNTSRALYSKALAITQRRIPAVCEASQTTLRTS